MTSENYVFASDKSSLPSNIADDTYSTNKVFSGIDIIAYVTLPGKKSYTLGNLNMISVSTHRDKFPVTALGRTRVKGFTSGVRICGGTLVFASFDRTVWHRMVMSTVDNKSKIGKSRQLEMFLPDELPPFDISITFANEYGVVSYTGVLGVTILDEGETYSVDNIAVMETYSYMAVDRIPFQPFDMSLSTSGRDVDGSIQIPENINTLNAGVSSINQIPESTT